MKTAFMSLTLFAALIAGAALENQTVYAKQGADDPVSQPSRGDDGNRGGERGRGRLGLPVRIDIEAPERGDRVGIAGRGWLVDLEIEFDVPLARSGFTVNPDGVTPGFQLTGPAGHNNVGPFPGTFSVGADDRLPGLIVLLTTSSVGAGPCQNLANLFNLTGVTDLSRDEVELWDTWIIGAPNFGTDVDSTLFVAVASDLNGDGIYNDAPDVVPDTDGDGLCTHRDLADLGLDSNVERVRFHINGPVDLSGLPVEP